MNNVTFKSQAQVEQEKLEAWRASASVSAFQAKAALAQAGHLPAIKAYLAQQDEDSMANLAWGTATEFRRLSPTVEEIGNALELSEEDKDQLFVTAAGIEA